MARWTWAQTLLILADDPGPVTKPPELQCSPSLQNGNTTWPTPSASNRLFSKLSQTLPVWGLLQSGTLNLLKGLSLSPKQLEPAGDDGQERQLSPAWQQGLTPSSSSLCPAWVSPFQEEGRMGPTPGQRNSLLQTPKPLLSTCEYSEAIQI